MATDADKVRSALVRICAAAGVSPDDASHSAAVTLRDHLRAALRPHEVELGCPLNTLLRRKSKVPGVLVFSGRVFLPLPVWERVPDGGMPGTFVPMLPAVAHAVELIDKPTAGMPPPKRVRRKVRLVCPVCQGARWVDDYYAAKAGGGGERVCRSCANANRGVA